MTDDGMIKFVLLHTSDIHSVFPAMPRIAGLAAELVRKHGPSPVVMVDCGDHTDRMDSITEGSAGAANLGVLEATGYSLVTIGNNEGLTFSKERLGELYGPAVSLTVLVANLKEKDTGRTPPWMQRSHVMEREGIRIGFIGATAPYSIFYGLLGWQVEDPVEAVGREVQLLQGQTDAIVVLSHLGLAADKKLAEEVDGISVILGGHTHHVLEEPLKYGSTYLCGCGVAGEYMGEVELYFDEAARSLRRVEGRLHRTAWLPEDPAVKQLLENCTRESARVLQEEAARNAEPMPVDWERDSPLGNLLAAGLKKWTGAELGLINSGQLLQSLLPGTITKGLLLEACPSPVNPCLIRIKGSALRLALEQSLLDDFVQMPIRGFGFRGKRLGGLCVDGMTVLWRPEGEPLSRISEIRVNGELLEPEREYRVGTADMFTFGVGYLSLKEGREPRYFLPEFLRDVLQKELNDGEAVRLARFPRFRTFSKL